MTFLSAFRTSIVVSGAIASAAVVMTGCANRGYMRASSTSNTVSEAATEIDTARRQIDEATTALTLLVSAPTAELKTTFERYRSAVGGLDTSVAQLKQKAQEMDAKGDKYFAAWDASLTEMKSEQMRARSAERQREVTDGFSQMRQQYMVARRNLDPLVSKLHDVRSLLSVDLTPAGVNNAREFLPNVEQDAKIARQSLDQLAEQFRALSTRLDPVSAAAK